MYADSGDLRRLKQEGETASAHREEYLHKDVTSEIINAFYHVYNTLGYGFLERVYQNALAVTLRKRGLEVEVRLPVDVHFEGVVVGKYFADLLVDRCVIIELKSAETLCEANEAQLLNYLRATDIEVGLLLNFGPKPQVKRKIFPNSRKGRSASSGIPNHLREST